MIERVVVLIAGVLTVAGASALVWSVFLERAGRRERAASVGTAGTVLALAAIGVLTALGLWT